MVDRCYFFIWHSKQICLPSWLLVPQIPGEGKSNLLRLLFWNQFSFQKKPQKTKRKAFFIIIWISTIVLKPVRLHIIIIDSKYQLTQQIYSIIDCKSFLTYIADRTHFLLFCPQKSHGTKLQFRQFPDVIQQNSYEMVTTIILTVLCVQVIQYFGNGRIGNWSFLHKFPFYLTGDKSKCPRHGLCETYSDCI